MLKGVAILVGARAGSALLGVLQTLLIAHYFGAGKAADGFFVASAVPVLFLGVVEANLSLTFTPLFVELEEAGDTKGAWTLAATLFKKGSLLILTYMVATMALAYPLACVLAPGFTLPGRRELAKLIVCLAPQSILIFISSTWAALYFIRGAFLLPAFAYIVTAAMPCLCTVLLHGVFQIYALPIGLVAGSALSCLLLYWPLGRAHPLFATPSDASHPAVKSLLQLMLPRTAATSLMQVNTAIGRVFASCVGTGHIAHLAYAQQMILAAQRLFIVPVGRSVMPAMSRAAARGQHQEMRSLVEQVTAFLGFVIVPAFALLIAFRHEVVRLVLGRGVFTESDVRDTAVALMFYGFGAFSAVLNPVLTAMLFALRDSLSPLKIVAAGVVLNVICNYIGVKLFSFGGIALATSLVSAFASVLLWRSLRGRAGEPDVRRTLGSLGWTVLAALAMVAAAKGLDLCVLAGLGLRPPVRLLLAGAAGGLVYLAAQALLNRQYVRLAAARVLRRARPSPR